MSGPRPGWYPDPAGAPELYRWWDGGDWTEAISESPRAPSPRTHHPADPDDDLTRRRPSRFRAVVALLVCLALFLSATVGLGLAIWHDPPSVRRSGVPAGASAVPGTSTGPVGRLDERSRLATVVPASMTLPGPPFALAPEPLRVAGLLEVCFLASAPVHAQGRGSWSAAVLLGRLTGTAGDAGALERQGEAAVQGLSSAFSRSAPTRLTHLRSAQHAVDGQAGVLVTAQVHHGGAEPALRHDQVTALVVGLDDGGVLVALSSVPDDAGAGVHAQARAALASLALG